MCSSQSSPNVFASSINKTFSFNGPQNAITPVTVTISAAGTASNYAQGGGGATLNSRDRGNPTGASGSNDNDMFQDLIFTGGSGSNTQSTNYLQMQFTGLTPSTSYKIAAYSYDYSSGNTEEWSATAPTVAAGYLTSGAFAAPADEQTITWATNGATPAPAVFTVTTDVTGAVSLWTFGGDGITADTSATSSYIDGFQIAVAPEPASIGLLAAGLLGLVRRQRRA